jgi:DNA topoisomerase-6 subunit B
LPTGDLVILVHIASVWVPFTNESKESVASYDEILREAKMALQMAGRKLGVHMRGKKKARDQEKKRKLYDLYLGEVAACCAELNGCDEAELKGMLRAIAARKTGQDGKKEDDEAGDQPS